MKAQHSPGPWKTLRSSDYTGNKEDSRVLSIEDANGRVVYYTDSGYFEPKEEDVALIAAAPELLEACIYLMRADSMQNGDRGGYVMGVISTAIDKARAAIAKATGEE